MIISSAAIAPNQRGAATVELTLLVPALLLVLGLLVAAGVSGSRVPLSTKPLSPPVPHPSLDRRAHAPLRAGTPVRNRSPRRSALQISLGLDAATFAVPVRTPSTVGSTILCMVDYRRLPSGWPGSIQLTGADPPPSTPIAAGDVKKVDHETCDRPGRAGGDPLSLRAGDHGRVDHYVGW